ncbi:hypothetical protein FEZ60_02120 [Rhodococcus sp. MS16]|uniref:hypothetical protein n=1 Tax=Rhodococcus TaxID=1827 RepID=UPI001202A54A|nr:MULTISPECIES: hypothetical protein [unclassified Rhodococcus (in: high G+C Gram-positive bacteria)]NRI64346.1 hypothetical protein [Rhodococcus sp. MS16]RZL23327.1 MAG: hypothetical protein EOP31_19735 [Rhodococcus sp. (in: high G+C Gram-positive bacteria)]
MNWKSPTETGWSVRIAADLSSVAIFDPAGIVRAELFPAQGDEFNAHFGRLKRETIAERIDRFGPALIKGKPATLRFPDGTAVSVSDEKRHGMRRRNKLCEVAVAGRHYRFEHSSGRKAAARRDGIELARYVRARGLRAIEVSRKSLSATDDIDECVLTLFQKVILPGREGAFGEIMSALSI